MWQGHWCGRYSGKTKEKRICHLKKQLGRIAQKISKIWGESL